MEKKITKREIFTIISKVAETIEDKATATLIADFCAKEIKLLDARKSKVGGKVAEKRAENETLKSELLTILANGPLCIAEIKRFENFNGLETSKISALLTQLKTAEKVVRTVVKGKPYYQTAPAEQDETAEETAE